MYTKNWLINKYNINDNIDYIFFWGHTEKENKVTKACFSQWYPSVFCINDITYYSAEQFMMAEKARLFNDDEILYKILNTTSPKEIKSLGRSISNFDNLLWDKYKYAVVCKGNLAKFTQNPLLKNFLLDTENKVIVEASPYDSIWGVGLSADDNDIYNPNLWKGENLLGFALMEVRDIIK